MNEQHHHSHQSARRFENRVVVVTGGGSGIGRVTAKMFAAEGAAVALLDRNLVNATSTAHEIEQDGGRARAFDCDVADEGLVRTTVTAIIDSLGPIDILVNNAGISITRPAEEFDAFDRSVAVNLSAAFYCARAVALASMIPRQKGVIVNISSIAGLAAIPGDIGYVTAKHGMVGLTKALAVEWAKYSIRVNAVAPGITASAMADAAFAAEPVFMAERVSRVPARRMAEPDEQADAILFLASDAASYISGVTLPVDGGQMALHSGMPQKR